MTVPLMIWSARTLIDNHACSTETSIPAPIAARTPTSSAGVTPKTAPGSASGIASLTMTAAMNPTNAAVEHHPLDADVDDAAPLVHHAAQRAERDRRGQRQGLWGEVRVQDRVDQVPDDLEDEPEEREVVQEFHQALVSP